MRAVHVVPLLALALPLAPLPALAQPVPLRVDAVKGIDPADDVIHYGNDFIVLDPPASLPAPKLPMDTAPWKVVYLNFDGATLNGGGNNSKTNNTDLILGATLDYPALDWTKLGGKEQGSKAVVDELKLVFLKFAVKFVTERPTEGDYTMAMVGGTGDGCKKGGPGTVGIAPLDCKNTNDNDICLIFGDEMNGSVRKLSLVIAHELGHTFGLEHITDPKGIMYPSLSSEVCCWVSAPVAGGSCGRPTQDAEKVLEENVGIGAQDTQAPLVWFLRPGEGAILPPDFTFEVIAADDLGVHHVAFFLDDKKLMEMDGPPYTQVLTGVADGKHVLKAEVHDWVKLKSTAQVTFTVDARCVVDGTCDAGTGGIGLSCQTGDDCTSGVCAVNAGGEGHCVTTCDGAAEAVCPTGLTCQQLPQAPADATWACLPAGDDWTLHLAGEGSGGGGCAVSPGAPPVRAAVPFGLVLLAAAGCLLAARKRRRR